MTTTICIPDNLYQAIEQHMHDSGISRDQFYANAVHHYLIERITQANHASVAATLANPPRPTVSWDEFIRRIHEAEEQYPSPPLADPYHVYTRADYYDEDEE